MKLLEIEHCLDCKYGHKTNWPNRSYCAKADKCVAVKGPDIPDWCPLPDAPIEPKRHEPDDGESFSYL